MEYFIYMVITGIGYLALRDYPSSRIYIELCYLSEYIIQVKLVEASRVVMPYSYSAYPSFPSPKLQHNKCWVL